MEKSNSLKNYEKEYSLEIKDAKIELDQLYELGISEEELKAEMALRDVYGDHVLKRFKEEETIVIEEPKSIQKIDKNDISLNRSISEAFEKIEKDEFNLTLEGVLAKAKNL